VHAIMETYIDNNDGKSNNITDDITDDITVIIKKEVQRLFLFNYNFKERLNYYNNSCIAERWCHVVPHWLPPETTATILALMPEDDVVHLLVGNIDLFKYLLKYLDILIIISVLFSMTDHVLIPFLLDTNVIFTDNLINVIMNDPLYQLYSLEPYHFIADRISKKSCRGVDAYIKQFLKGNDECKNIAHALYKYVLPDVLKALEIKINTYTERTNKENIHTKFITPIMQNIKSKFI
jgi:hypothetical protein